MGGITSGSGGFEGLPETHIERMDMLTFKAEKEKELAQIQADRDIRVAKENRKAERKEAWTVAAIAWAIAAVVATGIWAIWIDDSPPKSPEDYKTTEAGREEACIQRGGGWVPAQLLENYEVGLCVFPGKNLEVPDDQS